MALQLRPKTKTKPIPIPSFLHSFSSSSSNPDPNTSTANPGDTTTTSQSPPSSQPKSSFSSYFSDVKASLKLQHQQQHTPTPQSPRKPSFSFATSSPKPPSKMASLEEIRKNLSEFRRRSAAPSPTGPSSEPISFQELYKRNVIAKPEETSAETSGKGSLGSGKLSLDAIRESLRHLRSNNANVGRSGNDPISLSTFRKNLRLQPVDSNTVTGSTQVIGSGGLPASLFGKETEGKQEGDGSGSDAMKTEFIKMYSYEELGKKLKILRPEKKVQGENWFSLEELNERLMKLREVEEKETKSEMIAGVSFKDLRSSLLTLKMSNDEKTRKSTFQRLDILSHLGQTPNFMLGSPKEHLVEKYFHPDNMSSAEKLKIELQKVRDEFKMSESDCGSARVQVAQLTTKIKHLSSVLHKKDKHSRKGLIAMVQQRKKLLKYLRRSDWDSYCFVLSKLGLRDNPDYKT